MREVRSEREMWEAYNGPTREAQRNRKAVEEDFQKLFPGGHRTSILNWLEEWGAHAGNGKTFDYPFEHLNDVHPDAWKLLLKYGKDYRPYFFRGRKAYDQPLQPEPRECTVNTFTTMRNVHALKEKSSCTYVEGIAAGPLVLPMLHAWNGRGFSRQALDWTLYASTRWARYFGVPFTLEEYREIVGATSTSDYVVVCLLFHKGNFERHQAKILEVLTNRPRTRYPRRLQKASAA